MTRRLNRGDSIVVATHNPGKEAQIFPFLKSRGLTLVRLADFGQPEPKETGTTFLENARIKAWDAVRVSGLPALSDDSGIEIHALNGAPGVYTADWAEKPDGTRDFRLVMDRIHREAGQSGLTTRRCSFVTTMVMAWPDGHEEVFTGTSEGEWCWPPRGPGFGMEPIFVPLGQDRAFSEMSEAEKDIYSHRRQALDKLAEAVLPDIEDDCSPKP